MFVRIWRKLRKSPGFQRFAGKMLANYLKLIWATNRVIIVPADIYQRLEPDVPSIYTFWHGQHFLTSFLIPKHWRAKALLSRHGDAEMNVIAIEALGAGAIRGSGGHGGDFHRKGAVGATFKMLEALEQGYILGVTADVPKIARVAGDGIVTIARHSGRPIYPLAISASRRIETSSWDKASIYLPFGRIAVVFAEPVRVAGDASDGACEAARQLVQQRLDEISARAEELAGHKPRGAGDAR
jgi:lysophospholipid acyltransferase (LPLAT)-like uncharacterized protein